MCVERKRQRYRKRALVSDPLTRLHPPPAKHAFTRIFGPVLTRKGKEVLGKQKVEPPLVKFTPTATRFFFSIVNELLILPLGLHAFYHLLAENL